MATFREARVSGQPRAHNIGKRFPQRGSGVSPRAGGALPWVLPWVLFMASLLALIGWAPAWAGDRDSGAASVLGDWYVLVHYAGSTPGASGGLAWDDEVWRIETEGSGMRWTIFPHPEFREASGRWESLEGGAEARSSGAWQPNAAQLAEIAGGLAYAAHEERSKRLGRAPGGGWASRGGLRSASVSQVAYHEAWRITDAPPGPVFARAAAMGSGRTGTLKGGTRFETREVRAKGAELAGRYSRDGEFEGSFRMLRMAEPPGPGAKP